MYHSFFIYSSIDGYLGCSHVLAIVSSAAMNVGVYVSFSITISLGYMPGSGTVGSTTSTFFSSVQFGSVTQSCLTLCNPMDYSTPGFPAHHQLPELTQTHVHRVGDAIQPSYPLLSTSLPAFNLSKHQGLFQWVTSSHQVAKLLEYQLQHQSFQWMLRTDLL